MKKRLLILSGVVLLGAGYFWIDRSEYWAAKFSAEEPSVRDYGVMVFLSGILLVCYAFKRKESAVPKAGKVRSGSKGLDAPLLQLSRSDSFTVRDMLSGGIAIFGRTGSGKTSGSGAAFGRAIAALPASGGLILAAKPEDKAMWTEVFRGAGRERDLIVFEPDSPWRFNVLNYEMKQGAHTRNITRAIKTIGETLRQSDTKGAGEEGDFWEQQQERLIYNAVDVVKLATGQVTAPELQKFIIGAALSREDLAAEHWKQGYHNQCLRKAFERGKSAVEEHDYKLAVDFWLGEWPTMAEKTRSSILAHVMGILHVFNTGVVRELVSTETTVSPDELASGKWVLVNMAPAEWGDLGSFVSAAWKYMCQRMILRRSRPNSVVTIWMDEAQQFINSMDAHYLAQCRSHMGCVVALTQSKHSLYAALKGHVGRNQADALLSCFTLKVFHALGDVETAEWASSLIGKELRTFTGSSIQDEDDAFSAVMGQSKVSGNFNERYEAILQPNAFMHGLRCGGPEEDLTCDAIIVRSGKPFASGANWLMTSFSQNGGG